MSQETQCAQPAPEVPAHWLTCQGMNCGATDGKSHSPECFAEHAATIAGGTFVARPLSDFDALAALHEAGFYCRSDEQKRLILEMVRVIERTHRIGAQA